jgi:hypothetical protein
VSTVPPIDQQQIESALVRINARAWGVAMGLLLGLGLFLATVILLIRGGPNVGQHLQLISVFFPGYSVSWLGSVVGFIYAVVVGYGIGRVIGVVYNRLSTPS